MDEAPGKDHLHKQVWVQGYRNVSGLQYWMYGMFCEINIDKYTKI